MEEGSGELRRMQREQERERRRIRDRERRQSMTQEQRERHLARRRRNYQLRRQRAANNNNYNSSFFPLEAEAPSTSRDHPGLSHVSCSISDYRVLYSDLPLIHLHNRQSGQESSSLGSHNMDGSGVHMEVLTYKPTNLPGRLRLNHIRQLARNLIHPIADHDTQIGIHQVVPHLIPNADLSSQGSTLKSLRLNRVKQLARSLSFPSNEISAQNQNGTVREAANITSPETYGDGFKCC